MKTFEEKYTAWIDGKLSGQELADFERELEQQPEAAADRDATLRMGDLLRRHADAPALSNPDFFTHQIMHRIATESVAAESAPRRWWSWSLPQLAWAGAASLIIAGALFKTLIPVETRPTTVVAGAEDPASREYFAEIVDVRAGDSKIWATTIHDPEKNVTVLWLDGLDYLPATYKLQ